VQAAARTLLSQVVPPQHAIDTPTTFRQWCEDTLKPAVQAA